MKRARFHYRSGLMLCLGFVAAPVGADFSSQCPSDTDLIDTDGDGIVDNDHVCIHVTAGDGFVNMADGRLQYMFGFHQVPDGMPDSDVMAEGTLAANMPSPTIVLKEGQKLYLSLSNVGMMLRPDLFDPHSIHFHGFPQAAAIFDGVPGPSMIINMGSTFTYFYNIVEVGTYAWHCHVEATEHMQMGMLGNLYVLPIQNNLTDLTDLNGFTHQSGYTYAYNDGDGSTYYDVEYPIQIHAYDPEFHDASLFVQPLPFAFMNDTYPMLNGRGYPDTVNPNVLMSDLGDVGAELGLEGTPAQDVSSLIEVAQGQKLLLRISSLHTTEAVTLTTNLGVPMKVVGRDGRLLRGSSGIDLYYDATSLNVAGGETYDVIIDTTDVPSSTEPYFLYTTNLNLLSNNTEDFGGIMTEIVVNPSALVPAGGEEILLPEGRQERPGPKSEFRLERDEKPHPRQGQ